MTQYLFGDSDLAERRLRVLADVFADSTRAFLLEILVGKPGLAIDLGCGPGYSTHLLAEILQCDRVVGLDSSERFISLARKTSTDRVSFYRHDVTSVPFPTGAGGLLHCRFLLTHLEDPASAVVKWATQLTPQGRLFIEEVEAIHTGNPVFRNYLEILEAMLADQSNTLYVGAVLDRLGDTDTLKRRTSRITRVPVPTQRAATMFALNMRLWEQRPFLQTHYSRDMIEGLAEALNALAERAGGEIEPEWELRQLVFERV